MIPLNSFTDRIPKGRVTLFSDFVSESAPFGVVRSSNAIGTPTDAYSNGNSDGLGNVTCTLSAGTSAGLYQHIGIYPSVSLALPMTRSWRPLNGTYSVECRLRTSMPAAGVYIVTCGFSDNYDTLVRSGAYFYHLANQTTWRAAVSANFQLIREFDTKIPVASYQTLRVVSRDDARVFEFFANGNRVWKSVDREVRNDIVGLAATPMPNIEIRDRNIGGGGRENSVTADYMMVEHDFQR